MEMVCVGSCECRKTKCSSQNQSEHTKISWRMNVNAEQSHAVEFKHSNSYFVFSSFRFFVFLFNWLRGWLESSKVIVWRRKAKIK